jgi:hypothetical protein
LSPWKVLPASGHRRFDREDFLGQTGVSELPAPEVLVRAALADETYPTNLLVSRGISPIP